MAVTQDYGRWDIFIGKRKWCTLIAVTTCPISIMLKNYLTANIDWKKVNAVKLI